MGIRAGLEIDNRPLHRGGRAIRDLLESILSALQVERGVLFQEQPAKPPERASGHERDGEKDDDQLARRTEPAPKGHGETKG